MSKGVYQCICDIPEPSICKETKTTTVIQPTKSKINKIHKLIKYLYQVIN